MSSALELLQDTASFQPRVVFGVPKLLLDEALPQLGIVLDVSMMRCILQRALFGTGGRYRIEECAITHIRYRPCKRCLIAYRIAVHDLMTGQNMVQRLSAKILPPGLSEDVFARARRGAHSPTPLCDPALHLPDLNMVLWLFPNDPQLRGLPALIDERRLGDRVLPRLAAEDIGPDWALTSWHMEVVSYNPEHRCTLRAVVQLRHRETDELRARTYYGKAYPDDHTGSMTERKMKNLLEICSGPSAAFHVARPLCYEDDQRILWQTGVEGRPLSQLELGSPEILSLLDHAGRIIGILHSSILEYPGVAEHGSPAERLSRAAETLSRAEHCSTRLVERLVAAAGNLMPFPRTVVHRDLHLRNILSTDDGIALIDLDSLANGDPMEDFASFLAQVCSWSMIRGLDGPQIEPMLWAAVRSYVRTVPWEIAEAEFRWHLAAALVYQACHCITRPQGRRLVTLNSLIFLAERISKRSPMIEPLLAHEASGSQVERLTAEPLPLLDNLHGAPSYVAPQA